MARKLIRRLAQKAEQWRRVAQARATLKTSAQNAAAGARMTVDNRLYDRFADTWWDERGVLATLQALNPARMGYMRRTLIDVLGRDPARLRTLDLGCGGGLLAEEFARMGAQVTGVDPSASSLVTARRHAEGAQLAIGYGCAMGEALPFPDNRFDVVYCCDTLEHVADLERVVAEAARVLGPGGVFLFDTINRTWLSWLVMIFVLQVFPLTRMMPPRLHAWRKFIRPDELRRLLEGSGFVLRGVVGLTPHAGPLTMIRALLARRRGLLSYRAAMARMELRESPDTSIQYFGYALKP